jgi:hypothetical protein
VAMAPQDRMILAQEMRKLANKSGLRLSLREELRRKSNNLVRLHRSRASGRKACCRSATEPN